jgi:hypothetical protein
MLTERARGDSVGKWHWQTTRAERDGTKGGARVPTPFSRVGIWRGTKGGASAPTMITSRGARVIATQPMLVRSTMGGASAPSLHPHHPRPYRSWEPPCINLQVDPSIFTVQKTVEFSGVLGEIRGYTYCCAEESTSIVHDWHSTDCGTRRGASC